MNTLIRSLRARGSTIIASLLGTLLALTVMAVLILPGGCQNLQKPSPEQGAAIERVLVSTSATLALNKNPQYVPAATALADGIDAAVTENAIITADSIAAFVHQVCASHGVTPADEVLFKSLAISVYQVYLVTYKPNVISSTDPQVLLYVHAFRDGLRDAVAVVSAPRP